MKIPIRRMLCIQSSFINKLVFLIILLPLYGISADESKAIQKEVQAALMCQCGCSMTIENCNHSECGFSIPQRKRIAQMISAGKKKEEIVDFYVARFGQGILSAPPKSDIMAWVTPIIIAFVALGVLLNYLKEKPDEGQKTRKRKDKLPYDDLIEKELKEMD